MVLTSLIAGLLMSFIPPADSALVAKEVGLRNVTHYVGHGQYSGIAFLGGTQYAVVHDKLNGGGIVYFSFRINADGTVGPVSKMVPSGTAASKVSGLDNEGVAYNPTRGLLYVSAESDQSIREYRPDGTPTGRRFAVPADLGADKIKGNNGFEALTYNAYTERFWTTTESELKADAAHPGRLVLQSFGPYGEPGERYYYQMDAPSKTASQAAAANAYVHGVPALAALDDGRIIVMEREVFARLKSLSAFSIIKLYVVNPADGAATLKKKLLLEFRTSGLNLANYEGMCIGPILPDGSHTLVLIADTQDGKGWADEYIKVIKFK